MYRTLLFSLIVGVTYLLVFEIWPMVKILEFTHAADRVYSAVKKIREHTGANRQELQAALNAIKNQRMSDELRSQINNLQNALNQSRADSETLHTVFVFLAELKSPVSALRMQDLTALAARGSGDPAQERKPEEKAWDFLDHSGGVATEMCATSGLTGTLPPGVRAFGLHHHDLPWFVCLFIILFGLLGQLISDLVAIGFRPLPEWRAAAGAGAAASPSDLARLFTEVLLGVIAGFLVWIISLFTHGGRHGSDVENIVFLAFLAFLAGYKAEAFIRLIGESGWKHVSEHKATT